MMKKSPNSPLPSLLFKTCLGTLLGGLAFSGLAYHAGHPDLALGFLLGALLAPLNLLALRSLSARVLQAGEVRGRGIFWIHHGLRWLLFILLSWVLVQISIFCLLGALGSYTWFLAVLAGVGIRSAWPEK